MVARNWILCGAFVWVGSASCGNTTTEPNECVRGTIGCRCESDDSCNADLVCDRYGICARDDAAGTGGTGGGSGGAGGKGGSAGTNATGGKGGSGTGGSTGDAGDTGDAGETGSGGRNATAGRSGLAGTGGGAGTGGDAGNGGSSAGTSGSGGTAGSAGDTAGTSASAGVANAGTSGGGAGGSSGSAGSGGGGAGGTACTELTVDDVMERRSSAPEAASYLYVSAPVGAAEDDSLTVEFYSSAFAQGFNGEDTGNFQIGAGNDGNYATCSRCIRFIQDAGAVQFLAMEGEMSIPPLSDHMEGYPNLTLSDVTLREVTIEDVTFESTLVPQGRCFHLDSLAVALARPTSSWTCDEDYYFDNHCDCGCGIRDPDCANGTFGVCEYCNCPGEGTDCTTTSVSMSDNAICL